MYVLNVNAMKGGGGICDGYSNSPSKRRVGEDVPDDHIFERYVGQFINSGDAKARELDILDDDPLEGDCSQSVDIEAPAPSADRDVLKGRRAVYTDSVDLGR